MKKLIVFLTVLFFVCNVHANEKVINEMIKKIDEQKLYENPAWIALMHYKNINFGAFESTITDEAFFLSLEGKNNARDEMIADINGFFQDKIEEREVEREYKGGFKSKKLIQHPQCAFKARFQWLDSKLQISKYVKKQKCFAYEKWHKGIKGDNVSLVFASSYISNPASMFGHTFLRIDSDKNYVFNSETVNYSAITSQNPNGIAFALNGIFGGYPGIFTFSPYYEKIKSYGTVDNRDMIEYNLNLTKNEVDFLINHTWELSYLYSNYYFLNHNCSSFLIDMLNITRPELKMSKQTGIFVLPVETIRIAVKNKMVDNVKHRVSMQNKIKNRYKQLSDEEKKVADKIDLKKVDLLEGEFKNLSKQSKANVVDIIYDMQQYMLATKRIEVFPMRYNSFVLLREKNELGLNSWFNDEIILERVEEGHKNMASSLIYGNTSLKESIMSLTFMPLYHLLLDDDFGYVPFSSVKVGELKLSYLLNEEKLYFDKLTVFDLVSIVSDEAFFKSWSWKVALGYGKFDDYKRWNVNKDVLEIDGAFGKSYKVLKQNVYGMLRGGAKYSFNEELFEQDVLAYFGGNIGITFGYKKIKNIFDFTYDMYSDPAYNNYTFANSFGYNWNRNNRVELNLKFVGLYNINKIDRQIMVGYLLHF